MEKEEASKEAQDFQRSAKKKYSKPAIQSEEIFVQTQACGKCESGPQAQAGCLSVPQMS